jgi:hypothetical protein
VEPGPSLGPPPGERGCVIIIIILPPPPGDSGDTPCCLVRAGDEGGVLLDEEDGAVPAAVSVGGVNWRGGSVGGIPPQHAVVGDTSGWVVARTAAIEGRHGFGGRHGWEAECFPRRSQRRRRGLIARGAHVGAGGRTLQCTCLSGMARR